VEGLLHDGHLIERIDATSHMAHQPLARGATRPTTIGGMASKLVAARIAGHHGIPTVIANGLRPSVLTDLLDGKPVGTLCVQAPHRLSRHKWWIAFALRQPKGEVVIDRGAAEALLERGKSLLASGILEVRGRFEAGSCVSVTDGDRRELARGVTNFSSGELAQIQGLKSAEAAQVLGRERVGEAIHRDHLVFAQEVHP
jgi:glutamate 5-kinase